MKLEIEFAELHNPLFLAGTNLQMKLDPTKRTGLKLEYDRAEKELLVTYNGRMAIVPSANVSSMTPVATDPALYAKIGTDMSLAPKVKPTAQVASPTDHVFAGPGHGKTK